MAYTTPRTWVTGELVTAAMLNQQIRDNENAIVPNGPDAWVAWTPTVTQSGAVTVTNTRSRYMKVGRLVVVMADLSVTGAGTATNGIIIGGLPFAAAYSSFQVVGTCNVFDTSAASDYSGIVRFNGTNNTVAFRSTANPAGGLGASGFTAALAAGDALTFTAAYESAT